MKPEIKYLTEFPNTETTHSEEAWYHDHDDSLVILQCSSSNIYYPDHWTPLSIKCAFNGREYYKLKHNTYAVGDNSFLLLNEGSVYSSFIRSESVTESLTLNFTRNNIAQLSAYMFYSENSLLDDPCKISPANLRVYEKLYSHNHVTNTYLNAIKSQRYEDARNKKKLLEILHLFLYELVNFNNIVNREIDNVRAKKRTTREELFKRLHNARDYIESCYHEDISLGSLSKMCYMNTFHLLREFKKYFGTTPHQYLTGIRLQQAKKLITSTDLKVSDIMNEVGFEDQSSFSKLFKNYYGKSPKFFRKCDASPI